MKQNETRYFIRQYSQLEYRHGGIGYADAERILEKEGFVPVTFPHHHDFSFIAKINRFFYYTRQLLSIKKNSTLVFLFPPYARLTTLLVNRLLKKGVKCICFIADINGIKDGDNAELAKEIGFLKQFRHFIVHNEKMKDWLKENVPESQAASIEFFDFLASPAISQPVFSQEIVFAGNLEKSVFLEQLSRLPGTLHFHLYGTGQTTSMLAQKNVTWHGVEDPYVLPGKINGSFGLLWDGDAIDKPGGSLGNYMQYISHHKLSLYILSGLPLIVPASAASAPLVEKYKIGICINNLFEIEDKVNAISATEYRTMQENMQPLAERISRGEGLRKAMGIMLNAKC